MCLTWDYFEWHDKESEKFKKIIEELMDKRDPESLRTAELLEEEVWARDIVRTEGGLIYSTAYMYEHFLNEYPPLEELERRQAERKTLAEEQYKKEILTGPVRRKEAAQSRTEKLRACYHSDEDYETLAKRYFLEKMAALIALRLEKNRQRRTNSYRNLSGFVKDCLNVQTGTEETMEEYVFTINKMIFLYGEELASLIACQFEKLNADRSQIKNWKMGRPSMVKREEVREEVEEEIYRRCYANAIAEQRWREDEE